MALRMAAVLQTRPAFVSNSGLFPKRRSGRDVHRRSGRTELVDSGMIRNENTRMIHLNGDGVGEIVVPGKSETYILFDES